MANVHLRLQADVLKEVPGKVKEYGKDENGYYPIILGAVNTTNHSGAFYPAEPMRKILMGSNILTRKLQRGVLKGEYGHPDLSKYNSMLEKRARVLKIDEKNVCCHIKEISLEDGPNGIIHVKGMVKPSGPYSDQLKESLENPDENVYFSVRSLTLDTRDPRTGRLIKYFKEIITWDYVSEGGIAVANKYDTVMSSEGIDIEISISDLELIKMEAERNDEGIEDGFISDIEEIICHLKEKGKKPTYFNL